MPAAGHHATTDDTTAEQAELPAHAPAQKWQLTAEVGRELALPEPLRRVKVIRCVWNLRVGRRVMNRPRDPINPALDIEIEWADSTKKIAFVFPQDMPHKLQTDGFLFVYHPPETTGIKDYYSDVVILDEERHLQHRRIIEVNKPLHYRGYHLYQHSYGHQDMPTAHGSQTRWYTSLSVTSDTGLSVVYAGYIALCLGVFWQCWIRHIVTFFAARSNDGN